jgi:hypothetical protein
VQAGRVLPLALQCAVLPLQPLQRLGSPALLQRALPGSTRTCKEVILEGPLLHDAHAYQACWQVAHVLLAPL